MSIKSLDNVTREKYISAIERRDEYYEEIQRLNAKLKAYEAAKGPDQPVSLKKCANAAHDNMIKQRESMTDDYLFFNVKEIAKAVLDAVEVKYVD
jgi:hypothetical protein